MVVLLVFILLNSIAFLDHLASGFDLSVVSFFPFHLMQLALSFDIFVTHYHLCTCVFGIWFT